MQLLHKMSDANDNLVAIVIRQEYLFKSLSNYKKDSVLRKSKICYECRIDKVNSMCSEFINNYRHLT